MTKPIGFYVTFQRFTPESIDMGDAESRGWWDSGNWMTDDKPEAPAFIFDPVLDFDEDEHQSVDDAAVQWAVDRLKREGATQPSSTEDPEWWSTESEVEDFGTGATLVRSFHFEGFTPEQQEAINRTMFGQDTKPMATRKVEITLRALTAMEYTVTVDVPADADDEDLQEIARELYSNTDGSEFHDDEVTWDEGTHTWQEVDDDASETQSSVLHLTFQITVPEPVAEDFETLINEADYTVSHDLIEGTEITEVDESSQRVIVTATLHHTVTEQGAQEIAHGLHHLFQAADASLQYASELVDVDFPAWV